MIVGLDGRVRPVGGTTSTGWIVLSTQQRGRADVVRHHRRKIIRTHLKRPPDVLSSVSMWRMWSGPSTQPSSSAAATRQPHAAAAGTDQSPRMCKARLPRPAGPAREELALSASSAPRRARPHPPRPQTCRASCKAFGGNKGRRPPEFGRRGFRCCRALGCPPAPPSCSLATTHPAA